MKGMIPVGKNKVSDNHRAFNLYEKTMFELRESMEGDHFTQAIKTVANEFNLSLSEAKEAIYKGHAEKFDLTYEESKAIVKLSRQTTRQLTDFEEYYSQNRVDLQELEQEFKNQDKKLDVRSYTSWLSDKVFDEVEKIQEAFINLDRAVVID